MADFIVKFHDRHIRPPRGGWSYVIGGQMVQRYTESDILGELRKWRKNNNTFKTEFDLERELWDYYCSRQPERCGGEEIPRTQAALSLLPRDLTPEVMGPWVWQYLNLVAVRWSPGTHDYFLATCDIIVVLLECPFCREEWRTIMAKRSPVALNSRLAVCHWVNWAHNEVNKNKGKAIFSYDRMVSEYGAPLPVAD